jgi:tetratricopeptide (TPR) repeat protein
MSTDSSANNGPIEDRFAPFHDFEKDLCREIVLCSDVDKREQLTWKLATFYLETARPDKAIAHLKWIVETAQSEESKQASLRALQFLSGSEEKSIPASHESLDLSRVLWQMGNVFLGKGNQQPGVLCLLRLLDISSDQEQRAECFLLLGAECEKADDYSAAARFYQQGIECGPKEIRTRYFLHNNLGYCLNHFKRHKEASEHCRTAIAVNPGNFNAYKNLGIALEGLGRYVEAVKCHIKACNIYPQDSRALKHLEILVASHPEVCRDMPDIIEGIDSCRHAARTAWQ